jgi:cyclopropane-fatty-acyl-phospholipid synthase
MGFIKDKGIELFRKADVVVGGMRPWDIQVHDDRFYRRLLFRGSIALGESYVDGWWDCDAIDQFIFRILKAGLVEIKTGSIKSLGLPFAGSLKLLGLVLVNRQTRLRSAQDIRFHYSLGDDLFKATLDRRLLYSCGYWKHARNLDKAQEAKIDLICRKLKLKRGMTLLEIGCGYGGFAKFAADRYGVHVTGITSSEAHAAYAREYCRGSNVDIIRQDYRDIAGSFDRAVCIEMMEHVGHKNHREFAEKAYRCLKPGGLFLLQSISISVSTVRNDPWVDRYIFPGTIALSAKQITTATEGFFYVVDWHDFTEDYHKTMLAWFSNFDRNWPKLRLKYGDRFYRVWKYYLLCCPGTALAKTHHLWQVVLARIDRTDGYERVG